MGDHDNDGRPVAVLWTLASGPEEGRDGIDEGVIAYGTLPLKNSVSLVATFKSAINAGTIAVPDRGMYGQQFYTALNPGEHVVITRHDEITVHNVFVTKNPEIWKDFLHARNFSLDGGRTLPGLYSAIISYDGTVWRPEELCPFPDPNELCEMQGPYMYPELARYIERREMDHLVCKEFEPESLAKEASYMN